MPQQGYSIGRDIVLNINTGATSGNPLSLGGVSLSGSISIAGITLSGGISTGGGSLQIRGITGFDSKQEDTKVKIKRLDGEIDTLRFFEGWSGRFEVERRDATVDRYFNQLESNYFQGFTEAEVTIMESVIETNGTTSRFLYRKVLLSLDNAGTWQGDTSVKQSIMFVASRRQTQ